MGGLPGGGNLHLHASPLAAKYFEIRRLAQKHVVGSEALLLDEMPQGVPVAVLLHNGADNIETEGQSFIRVEGIQNLAGHEESRHGGFLVHRTPAVDDPVDDSTFEGRIGPALLIGDLDRIDVGIVENLDRSVSETPDRVAQTIRVLIVETVVLHLVQDELDYLLLLPAVAADADQTLKQIGKFLLCAFDVGLNVFQQLGIHIPSFYPVPRLNAPLGHREQHRPQRTQRVSSR